MTLRKLEDLTGSELRDHGTRERIDRGWRRVSADLESATPRPRPTMWWAPAAAAIIFGSGVVVGAKWARPEPPAVAVAERPGAGNEPASPSQLPAPAAEQRRPAEPARNEPHRSAARPPFVQPVEPSITPEPTSAPVFVEAPVPPGPPEWKQLADAGDFKKARLALDRAGGFDAVVGGANSQQLMSVVDIARSTGSRDWAISALRQVLDVYPNSAEAPEAAYTLGNILEQMGDEIGAADAFATYRRLSPRGDFTEDTIAREVDAALDRGELEQASKLIDQYAKDFPNGRRLDEFRRELDELRAADAGAEAPAPPAAATPRTSSPAAALKPSATE